MTALLGGVAKGKIFVVSGPAGAGKTTLVQMLMQEFPAVVENISYTTRKKRAGEEEGVHYHFITEEEFERKIDKKEMLEYARIYGYYYGSALESIARLQNQGKHVVLVIDTQGALLLMGKIAATFIFIRPPEVEILRKRLESRKTESLDDIEVRLQWAVDELQVVDKYDYCIVNDDLKTAYEVLRSILIAEERRIVKLKMEYS